MDKYVYKHDVFQTLDSGVFKNRIKNPHLAHDPVTSWLDSFHINYIIAPIWGESTDHRWLPLVGFPSQRDSDTSFDISFMLT